MDLLPPELFIKIFSFLTPQLLEVEQVCPKWQRVIPKYTWDGLTSINEETIGYPNEDYLNNFIRLAQRVQKVKEFISPFELINEHLHSPEDIRTELRKGYLSDSLPLYIKLRELKNSFDMLTEYFRSSLEMEIALKKATLTLAKKLTLDGMFPLDVIRHVVTVELREQERESKEITYSTIEEFH